MNESPPLHIYKFRVNALTNDARGEDLQKLLQIIPDIEKVDMNIENRVIRIIASREIDVRRLAVKLSSYRFHLERLSLSSDAYRQVTLAKDSEYAMESDSGRAARAVSVRIQGMTCHSCELLIERAWQKIPGVTHVQVNAGAGKARLKVNGTRPSIDELERALGESKYRVMSVEEQGGKQEASPAPSAESTERPSFGRIVGLIASVLFIGYLLKRLNLLKVDVSFGEEMSFAAVFVIGLVAASSSCIAVSGGLLLSSMSRFNQQHLSETRMGKLRPVMMFVLGRIASYGFFGGLLGVVGKAIVPSPLLTGFLIILAAFYMFVMGMEMLHIAPPWLKRLLPSLPKKLSHRIMDKESNAHPLAPFLLGAGTFFLPCGFTQALQLYALTTGSFTASAITLFAFALGTAPSLLALGWASGSLKGKAGKLFFQFSGALVIVLGVWNFQSGLNLIGYPLSLGGDTVTQDAQVAGGTAGDTGKVLGAKDENDQQDVQVVKMAVNKTGYSPSQLTVEAGKPVRWEVDGTNAGGCITVLVSRSLGIQEALKPGVNVFEFTPKKPGKIPFSCSMGMYRGSFTVVSAS